MLLIRFACSCLTLPRFRWFSAVPWHPLRGLAGESVSDAMQDRQVVEGIHARQLTRVDQAHEQIADASAASGFIEQRIPAVQNRFLQCAFNNAAIERGARNA